jgi:signal transduction histidine kinase
VTDVPRPAATPGTAWAGEERGRQDTPPDLAMLAHELRRRMAALRVVGEAIELLRARGLDPAAMLDRLAGEIQDLDDLARAVLRGDRGADGQVQTGTDVVAAVRAAARTVATARQTIIRVQVPPDEVQVTADPTMLRQAVENLLDNATAHGGPDEVEVAVHPDRAAGQVEVVVADRGAAAAEAGPAPAAGDAGHGIGLFLVRRFLDDAGGRSWVAERHGGGTLVGLSLPLPPAGGSDPLVAAVNT